jgi:IS30 family transposase
VTFQRELVASCLFAMKLRNLTTEEKGRIVGLHEAGISGAQIGRQLGIARQTISALL